MPILSNHAGSEPLDVTLRWRDGFDYRECLICVEAKLNIHLSLPAAALSSPDPPLTNLTVERILSGGNQARSNLAVLFKNRGSVPVRVVYLETMPWLLQFYLHTIRITLAGHNSLRREHLYCLPFTKLDELSTL